MIVILMGVSGVGKTAVGRMLASELGWVFHEGDDFHPPANINKLTRGQPLSDDDRQPWLDALRQQIETDLQAGLSAVVTCSALKKKYRDFLRQDDSRIHLVSLEATADVLAARLSQRKGHFFNPLLLADQLSTLEPVHDAALRIDAGLPLKEIVATIRQKLDLIEPTSH